jgi:ACS family hexuronate transporter-like MFS transporter
MMKLSVKKWLPPAILDGVLGSTRSRWFAVSVFALASTWNYLDRLILSAAAPRIKAEFHLNNAQFGWLISAFSLAYATASPAVGWFLDRVGLEMGIIAAVALWSISAAICGFTRTFGQLTSSRIALGAFESAGVPAAGKLNAIYLEPKDRAIGAAFTQVGLSIGGIAAPLLVAAMPGWRRPFFVCAALGILWLPFWTITRRRVAAYEPVAPQKHAPGFAMLMDRRLLLLAGANILWMVIYSLWSNWTTIFLVQKYGLTTEVANGFAWFPPLASTVGAFTGGWLSRVAIARGENNVEARNAAILVSAFGCLSTIMAPLCPNPLLATIVIACSYFSVTAGSVNLYTIPLDIWGGEHAGSAISALVFAYGLLQAGVSPLIGGLVDRFGFAPVCWMAALPPFAGWLMLRRLNPGRLSRQALHY